MMSAQRRTLDQWLALVAELAPHIRAAQAAADRDCRLPQSLVERLAQAGLFRLWLPTSFTSGSTSIASAPEERPFFHTTRATTKVPRRAGGHLTERFFGQMLGRIERLAWCPT